MPDAETKEKAAETKESTEETPLLSSRSDSPEANRAKRIAAELHAVYGGGSHATFVKPPGEEEEYIVDYDVLKLSSFRVCSAYRGTILQDPVLLTEQIILTILFFAMALPVYYYFKTSMEVDRPEWMKILPKPEWMDMDMTLKRWIGEQESKMRAFAMIMTGLAAFLLSFYTAISVGRWWIMRTGGVGGIKAATVDLELLLYQNVTQDEEVLSAVRRYGRTSLFLIFLWRTKKMNVMEEELTKRGLLTEHEAKQLLKWNHVLHETIWAWQSAIVTMLYKEGKIKSDQLFQLLLEKCLDGRSAVQLTHTHLAVRVPMQYIHLLGLLVKMHNGILAIIMGLLFGAAWGQHLAIVMIQCFGRTLILPFLFNAILLINAELSDPFDGGEADFPVPIYQAALEKDCQGMLGASQNMPDWLSDRFKKAKSSEP